MWPFKKKKTPKLDLHFSKEQVDPIAWERMKITYKKNDEELLIELQKLDDHSRKCRISYYTPHDPDERCFDFDPRKIKDLEEIDVSNVDMRSYFTIASTYGDCLIMEQKMDRSQWTIYLPSDFGGTEQEIKSIIRDDNVKCFNIRIADLEFGKQFLENMLGRKIE